MLNVDVARNNTNDQYQVSLKYFSIFLFPLPCELQYQNSLYCDLVCMFMILQRTIIPSSYHHIYQTLTDPIEKTYATHSECSIEFEVDGPYKVRQSSMFLFNSTLSYNFILN
jgi:hypothetical protein